MKFSAAFLAYVCSAAILASATATNSPNVQMLTKASLRSPNGAIYCECLCELPRWNIVQSCCSHYEWTK